MSAETFAVDDSHEVSNRQRKISVGVAPLRDFLRTVKKDLGLAGSQITVGLVSDTEIARMNKAFRKMPGPTDVLSFPAVNGTKPVAITKGSPPIPNGTVLGDIAIAPETARRYARKDGRSLSIELRILILHGVLHLLGYDHESDRGEMSRLENRLRSQYGLPR